MVQHDLAAAVARSNLRTLPPQTVADLLGDARRIRVAVATDATAALDRALDDPIDDAERDLSRSFYENYGPDAILSGAVPSYVTLHEPDWRIDPDELRAAFGPRTRPLIGPWD